MTITYESSVYTRTISYRNFNGRVSEVDLHFALDPMRLLSVMADAKMDRPAKKSGNPSRKAQDPTMSEARQLDLIRSLAVEAAGFPSEDGESWEPFPDFENQIAGQAFLTKLASSDGDRKEFAQKVILDPFRAFISYAEADESNSKTEVKQFSDMLKQMENIFSTDATPAMSLADRKAALAAEMAALEGADEISPEME